MKFRHGFVSNSSSSSFMIPKQFLTQDQVDAICDYSDACERVGLTNKFINWKGEEEYQIPWHIDENVYCIKGDTFMDNFDMCEFLKRIGVDMDKVEWSD